MDLLSISTLFLVRLFGVRTYLKLAGEGGFARKRGGPRWLEPVRIPFEHFVCFFPECEWLRVVDKVRTIIEVHGSEFDSVMGRILDAQLAQAW